jgi:hypothetical protein
MGGALIEAAPMELATVTAKTSASSRSLKAAAHDLRDQGPSVGALHELSQPAGATMAEGHGQCSVWWSCSKQGHRLAHPSPQLRSQGGETSAPAMPGLLLMSSTTPGNTAALLRNWKSKEPLKTAIRWYGCPIDSPCDILHSWSMSRVFQSFPDVIEELCELIFPPRSTMATPGGQTLESLFSACLQTSGLSFRCNVGHSKRKNMLSARQSFSSAGHPIRQQTLATCPLKQPPQIGHAPPTKLTESARRPAGCGPPAVRPAADGHSPATPARPHSPKAPPWWPPGRDS